MRESIFSFSFFRWKAKWFGSLVTGRFTDDCIRSIIQIDTFFGCLVTGPKTFKGVLIHEV